MIKNIDCACVIYGTKYHTIYVEKLFKALTRAFSIPIRLHVLTESDRVVPAPLIKHSLSDWSHLGVKQGWWYKLQLFNREFFGDRVIYFDLDVVITGSLDWILALPLDYFWSIQDFRRLWRPSSTMMNSSVMYWNAACYHRIFDNLGESELVRIMGLFRGDQEYLSSVIRPPELRFFDNKMVKSWRWEVQEGGFDFDHRQHRFPGRAAVIDDLTSILVFHGDPNPHEVRDALVKKFWWQ